MHITNALYPAGEQMQAMLQPGPPGPIIMVNLLKFRAKAEYADGRASALTGREAYTIYAEGVTKLLAEVGGRVLFAGDVTFLSIGQADSLWDEVALAEYPDRKAMVAMSSSPAFREIAVHRAAGLEGQLNIETVYNQMFKPLLSA